MVLEFSKSFVHKTGAPNQKAYSPEELQNIMIKLMEEKGIEIKDMYINADGTLELNGLPYQKMHSVLLEAEELGLTMKMTRKTVIELV
ncbi:MAG: hypothetical protein AAF598_15085 [Bacteroidota bacterium]